MNPMNHKLALLPATCLCLAGCMSAPPPPPPEPAPQAALCEAGPGQAFLGQKATEALGTQLIEATGARILRWVPPRTAVTMDFRPDRLTVSYDDDMAITQVSCS